MIVNETAKFENPDIVRDSSCAYPSWCRRFSSSVSAGCGSRRSVLAHEGLLGSDGAIGPMVFRQTFKAH